MAQNKNLFAPETSDNNGPIRPWVEPHRKVSLAYARKALARWEKDVENYLSKYPGERDSMHDIPALNVTRSAISLMEDDDMAILCETHLKTHPAAVCAYYAETDKNFITRGPLPGKAFEAAGYLGDHRMWHDDIHRVIAYKMNRYGVMIQHEEEAS